MKTSPYHLVVLRNRLLIDVPLVQVQQVVDRWPLKAPMPGRHLLCLLMRMWHRLPCRHRRGTGRRCRAKKRTERMSRAPVAGLVHGSVTLAFMTGHHEISRLLISTCRGWVFDSQKHISDVSDVRNSETFSI